MIMAAASLTITTKMKMILCINEAQGEKAMKKMKKLIGLLLITCMLCMNLSIVSHAATAELRFTDPETTVGAEVEVTATFTATYPVQSMDATLSYDKTMLKFISGSQVTDNDGTLSITGGGDGSKVVTVTMKFQALSEGTTIISVTSSDGVDTDGDPIDIVNGKSTVEIDPGDPSLIKSETPAAGTLSVDVGGVSYTLVEDFTDLVIPDGFERSELELDGGVHTVVKQTTSETTLAYLRPADGEADFFLFNADNATFSQFEQAEISTGRYLIFMNDVSGVKVPDDYVKTTITLSESGKTFPAWQSTSQPDYYLVYGMNSDGNKNLYTYDTVDGTYQRFQNTAKSDEKDDVTGKLTNKLLGKLGGLMDLLIIVVAAVVFLLLILLIVIAVKLRHRNLELDDLYDEYGIDLDDEEKEEPVKETKADKKARKKEEKKAKKNKKYDDDLYDFDDEDDEYDDYDEAEYDDYEEAEDDYEEAFSEYDASDYEDESKIDDLDAMLNARVQKKADRKTMVTVSEPRPKQIGHSDPCDTFKMDLIDLD